MADVSTNAKIEALAEYLRGVLEAERSGLNVETRYRRASETGRNRGDQREVLGDPVYYLEVLPASADVLPESRDPSGTYQRRTHDLQVVFLFAYEDGPDRATASQGAFNDLLDALHEAVGEGHLTTDEGPQTMEPQQFDHQFTSLSSRGDVIAHELTFTVTLTDQHQ
jgi:hypothetical protein